MPEEFGVETTHTTRFTGQGWVKMADTRGQGTGGRGSLWPAIRWLARDECAPLTGAAWMGRTIFFSWEPGEPWHWGVCPRGAGQHNMRQASWGLAINQQRRVGGVDWDVRCATKQHKYQRNNNSL